MRILGGQLTNALLFSILATTALSAQGAEPQPLGLGGDKLYDSTAEYMAQHPNCFLPRESIPSNYRVSRYRDNLGENNFDCQVTSVRDERLHLLGFRVRKIYGNILRSRRGDFL